MNNLNKTIILLSHGSPDMRFSRALNDFAFRLSEKINTEVY